MIKSNKDCKLSLLLFQIYCGIYLLLACVSVSLFLIPMQPWGREDNYLDPDTIVTVSYFDLTDQQIGIIAAKHGTVKTAVMIQMTDPKLVIVVLDFLITFFFAVETLLHFITCPCKRKYFRDIYNVIRVSLLICSTVSSTCDMKKTVFMTSDLMSDLGIALRSFSVFRLLLMFKLRKVFASIDILLLSLERSLKELMLLLFAFLVCVTVYGVLIYAAEVKQQTFTSIIHSMWWAVITMTTIGYGDYYPTTTGGYIVGVICALNGLIVLALPVAAIASNFANFYSQHNVLMRHKQEVELLQATDNHATDQTEVITLDRSQTKLTLQNNLVKKQ